MPRKGYFEFVRTPQGMRNSCAAFQRLLDFVTQGLPFVSVYIDDLIGASNRHKQHLEQLEKLFARIRQYNLKIQKGPVEYSRNHFFMIQFDTRKGF